MYENLVQRLREEAIQWCANCVYKSEESHICHAPEEPSCDIRDRLQAADAIEERDRYALTLQHEMMAEAESHIALVERLNKQTEELQKQVAYWQAQLTKSMCGETLAELEKPRWVSVKERLPEKGVTILDATFSVDVLGFDGWNYRRAYYNYTAKVWLNGNDEQEWPEITHWISLPSDPAPLKEVET